MRATLPQRLGTDRVPTKDPQTGRVPVVELRVDIMGPITQGESVGCPSKRFGSTADEWA